jgi:hypothetical protein
MFLVAGLAVAGIAGILAAIYFSVRSAKRGGKRLRPAAPRRIGADRAAPSRPGAVRRPGGRAALVRTGGQTEFALRASGPTRPASGPGRQAAGSPPSRAQASALTESWPAAPSDLEGPQSADAWPDDEWPDDSMATDPGLRAARPGADLDRAGPDAPGAGAPRDSRARRRVGFRKGADIDEELWPAETFGGVSDEQFWDDLASDKPLTTTARTAQQEAGPRSRLLDTGSDTDPQGTQALGSDLGQGRTTQGRTTQGRADQGRADQGRAGQGRAEQGRTGRPADGGRRSAGYGAYPGPRTAGPRNADPRTAGLDPAAERTLVQPAYAATQPVKSMAPPPVPATPKPFPGATQPAKSATPPPGAPQPVRAAAAGTGPSGIVGQPRGVSGQPGQPGRPRQPGHAGRLGQAAQPGQPGQTARRRRPSSEEDPLTSSSFSLRQRGPVDGRSSLRSRDAQDAPGDRGAASGSGRGAASPYGPAAPYPPAGTSYDDASSATQMMSAPAYGEDDGYGGGSQADHLGHRNGARSHARPGGTGERPRPARQAYPEDVRQASGSYPAGAYPGSSGHGRQPAGYPGSGQADASRQGSGYPSGGYEGSSYQGGNYPGGGSRGNGHRAPHDPRDDYRRLTHRRLPSRLGSCPRETWSGRPPAACTRRWRDGR